MLELLHHGSVLRQNEPNLTYLLVSALVLHKVTVHLKNPPAQFARERILLLALRKSSMEVRSKIALGQLAEVEVAV